MVLFIHKSIDGEIYNIINLKGDINMGSIIEKNNQKETDIKPKLVFVREKNGQIVLKISNVKV